MKLLDKLKDILFDEEEEEVEENVVPKKVIKHEVSEKVEKVEEKVEEEKPVDNNINLENTFKFPLFDEQEFESTKPKSILEPKKNFGLDEIETYRSEFHREEKKPIKELNVEPDYDAFLSEKPKEKGVFKPSPIISPVYGILNKNYDKDSIQDIGELNTTTLPSSKPKTLNVDDVRKKAFGQLDSEIKSIEELNPTKVTITEIITNPDNDDDRIPDVSDTMELKQTLTGIRENLENISGKMADIETKVDNHFETEDELDKPRNAVELLNQIEDELDKTLELRKQDLEEIKDDYLDDFEDVKYDDVDEVEDAIEEKVADEPSTSDTDNSDELFNLIDAMYDNTEDTTDETE